MLNARTYLECEDLVVYFDDLKAREMLTPLAELRTTATALHHRYSTQKAWFNATEGGASADEAGWLKGTPWPSETGDHEDDHPPASAQDNLQNPSGHESATHGGEKHTSTPDADESSSSGESEETTESDELPEVFEGDNALARSILLMNETMLARDAAQAVASGDVGRVWNDLKVRRSCNTISTELSLIILHTT